MPEWVLMVVEQGELLFSPSHWYKGGFARSLREGKGHLQLPVSS